MSDLSFLPEPLRNPNNCQVEELDGFPYSYGYRPSLAAGITFCVLFAIALAGHVVQSFRFRRWTSILLAIGALTELIGWGGRTWSSECPYNQNAYLMQITTLIIAPVFFTAALYVLLGVLILLMGRQSSLLSARMYTIIFLTCDVISLVVQAVGGALASQASGRQEDPQTGTDIMIAGVIFQLVAMTVFAVLAIDFSRRSVRFTTPQGFGKVMAAMFISLVAIYARSIFRAIELAEGWQGYLITHEEYFIGLDGALMVLAVGIFLVMDPASILPKTTGLSTHSSSEELKA